MADAIDLQIPEQRLDTVLQALNQSLLSNSATGMGTSLDPTTRTRVNCGHLLSESELRALYRGSWLIRRIVEAPAYDMTKAVDLVVHSGSGDRLIRKAMQVYQDGGQLDSPYARRQGCDAAIRKAIIWARLFGQGYCVMRVNGGEDPEKPLTKVRSFEGLSVLDRYSLRPALGTINPESPEFYQVARHDTPGGFDSEQKLGQRIHESRVLVFSGAMLHPFDIQIDGDGGHDSIIQQVYDSFVRHMMAKDAISKGLDSYSLFKVAISGLSTLLQAPNGTATLTNYLNTVAQQMSMHRIIVQDTEASKSEFQERSFAGVAENFKHFVDELTAAAYPLPHYKIWGSVDKAGLADSGGAEARSYAANINSMQNVEMKDEHRRLFHAIFEAVGRPPKSWDIEYPSIYTPTPEEEGAIAKQQSETLTTLVRDGVITPTQAYQALATGQPLENVLVPLEDDEVLTIVDEAEEAGPSAEEELAALLQGGEQPAPGDAPVAPAEESPQADPAVEAAPPEPVPQFDSAEDELAWLLGDRTDAGKGGGKGKGKRGKRTEKPNCTRGRSCGLSCVDNDKRCQPDLSPAAKAAADALARRAPGGAGGSRGNNQDPFAPATNPLPRRQPQQPQDPFDPATNPLPQRRQPQPQDPFDPAVNPVPRRQAQSSAPQPIATAQSASPRAGVRAPKPLPSGVAKSRTPLGAAYDFSVGGNAVNMRIEKSMLDVGKEVTFYINGSFEMSELPTAQKNRMALTLAKTFRAETSSVPDGTIYQTAAYTDDGAGAYRTKAYQSFGFGKPSESDQYMYGIVRNGKLEPIDEDEALRLSA